MPATKGISEQDILLVFDKHQEPFLTAPEIADELDVSAEAVRYHLKKMEKDGTVSSKDVGARAVGWWAEVAPRLDPDVAAEVEDRGETDEFTPLDEI